jgi:hypothetical protein
MLSAASEVAWATLVGHGCDLATNSGSHLEDDEEPRKPALPTSSGAKRPAWVRMGQDGPGQGSVRGPTCLPTTLKSACCARCDNTLSNDHHRPQTSQTNCVRGMNVYSGTSCVGTSRRSAFATDSTPCVILHGLGENLDGGSHRRGRCRKRVATRAFELKCSRHHTVSRASNY